MMAPLKGVGPATADTLPPPVTVTPRPRMVETVPRKSLFEAAGPVPVPLRPAPAALPLMAAWQAVVMFNAPSLHSPPTAWPPPWPPPPPPPAARLALMAQPAPCTVSVAPAAL